MTGVTGQALELRPTKDLIPCFSMVALDNVYESSITSSDVLRNNKRWRQSSHVQHTKGEPDLARMIEEALTSGTMMS
jgi:hypothetical protein